MGDEGIGTDRRGVRGKTKVGEVWKNIGDKMMLLFDYVGTTGFLLLNFLISAPQNQKQNTRMS